MRNLLYPRLAAQNLSKNGRFYFPYLLTIMGTSAAFYIMQALAGTDDLPDRIRYSYLTFFMQIGGFVVGVFAVIFLFYTNSFLMKRRGRELGLYNILGMGKRHLARMLLWETVYTIVLGIGGGVICGLLLQKLITLLLYRLMQFDVPFGFYISYKGITTTAIFFAAILLVDLLYNLLRIRTQNPIELLHAGSHGDREPRTRWLLAILGVLALGAGYAIAVLVNDAMSAFVYYFVAVFAVIIGTYCLFTALSIAVLKALRRNKRFYYQTRHFIGVSGMLHRMNRNAVGLANICILSTMVLVMISGTLSLYLGTAETLDANYPGDLTVCVGYDPTQENVFREADLLAGLRAGAEDSGRTVESASAFSDLGFGAFRIGERFIVDRSARLNGTDQVNLFAVTADDYTALTGVELPALSDHQVLVCEQKGSIDGIPALLFAADNATTDVIPYEVAGYVDEYPNLPNVAILYSNDQYGLIVADDDALRTLATELAALSGDRYRIDWYGLLDIDGTDAQQKACANYLTSPEFIDAASEDRVGQWDRYYVSCRAAQAEDVYSLNGGFFFLGSFLGLIFIMATVLILYYKQLSEGYEDAERFRIMQQVGLEPVQLRKSVSSQLLAVFFLPLLVAAVHVAFDLKLIILLLNLFSLSNWRLTALCTLGTLLVFAAIYWVVYRLTARSYYRIVRGMR